MNQPVMRKAIITSIGAACALLTVTVSRPAFASYASTVLADSPSVYYQFSETSGTTAVDSSVNANNGTYVSPILLNQLSFGVQGPSIGVTGAGSGYVDMPAAAVGAWYSNPGSTFEAWFKTSANGIILGQFGPGAVDGGAAGYVPAVYVGTDGKLRGELFWHGFVGPLTSSASVNDGQWHYVADVFDSGTETLYLDGSSIATAGSLGQSAYNGTSYAYKIGVGYDGGWPGGGGGWTRFNGNIDEAAFYQTALTAEQIQLHYIQGINVPEPSSLMLLAMGMGTIVMMLRRKKV